MQLRGLTTNPAKPRAYGNCPSEREKIPPTVKQPSYTMNDGTLTYGMEIVGAPFGDKEFQARWLEEKGHDIARQIKLVATCTALIDPHSGTAITLYSLQTQADFVMSTNLPSMTVRFAEIVDAAIIDAFAKTLGSDLLAINDTLTDPSFVPDRAKLRTAHGGAGIRLLHDSEPFLNTINNVVPQFIDKQDADGNITPGIFPTLINVLGPGSFDQGNENTRWTAFLTSGEIGAEFRAQHEKGKVKHGELINGLQQLHIPGSENLVSIFDIPVEQFGTQIKKLQRAIRDELQNLKFLQLQHRAGQLPIDDQRRIAFFANSLDVFSNQLIGMPHYNVLFTPEEYKAAIAMKFGLPIAALQPFVGDRIRNSANCPQLTLDIYGNHLSTIGGSCGGHTQRLHNSICGMISTSAMQAGIKCLGGDTDTSAKRVFSSAIPAHVPIDATNTAKVNSMVPDIVIDATHTMEGELGRSKHIVDVKTLAAGLAYKRNTTNFADAVARRTTEVNNQYHNTAKQLDRRLHGTPVGTPGPFQQVLSEYGGLNHIVLGPVVGFFGEASEHMYQIRDLIAINQAKSYQELYRSTNAQANGLHKQQLNRLWGHTFARGWARLILDRLRDLVCPEPRDYHRRQRAPNSDQNEEFLYFHPNVRAGAFDSRQAHLMHAL